MRRRTICLVDDQADEIARFRHFLQDRYVIGAGTSLNEAMADLERQGYDRPDLVLIDMYRSDKPADHFAETTLYRAREELLRAEKQFNEVLADLQQSSEGGFRSLREVRSRYRYPRVATAFFTRKGTIDNAIAAYEDGIPCPVIKKPDPRREEIDGHVELAKLYDHAYEEQLDNLGPL